MKPEIKIAPDRNQLCRIAAELILDLAKQAVRARKQCTLALSGGSTPEDLYKLLADDAKLREQFPWESAYFFWGDERHVPPDHKNSNYRMANEAMLRKVPVPEANVYRIRSEDPNAGRAARNYERELRRFFKLGPARFPRFDIVLMGLGPEGHTASLFPGTKALHEKKRLVVSNWVGKFYTDRITLTAALFNRAANVVFLVSGDEKAIPVKAVLEGKYEPEQLPAQLVHPAKGTLLWLLDKAAAKFLGKDVSESPVS